MSYVVISLFIYYVELLHYVDCSFPFIVTDFYLLCLLVLFSLMRFNATCIQHVQMKYAASCKTRFIHLYKMSYFKVFPFTVNLGQGAEISPCATSVPVCRDWHPFYFTVNADGICFCGDERKVFLAFSKRRNKFVHLSLV